MTAIKRDYYLNRLLNSRNNGMIKIVTGLRRCGKSFLLFNLFYDHLKKNGVDDAHIIKVDLEDRRNKELRNPDALLGYIDKSMCDNEMYYILLDEVQHVPEFADVLNSYLKVPNADVYVTGSNSRFLSKDVVLSFSEFYSVCDDDFEDAWNEYMTYGGLPQVAMMPSREGKEEYLKNLFESTYIRDIKERNSIRRDADLEEVIDTLASSIGTLTNPSKLQNTFKSVKNSSISSETIKNYIDILQDAFLVEKSVRYDIKGRKYIGTPAKYYFEDLGLRNARLNFRQVDAGHLMENMLYNELRLRGLSVDVGQVVVNGKDANGKSVRKSFEVDFVCNRGFRRCYIQSAVEMPTPQKVAQEQNSLLHINDGFSKVIVVGGMTPTHQNEEGILIMNIFDFLLGDGLVAVIGKNA